MCWIGESEWACMASGGVLDYRSRGSQQLFRCRETDLRDGTATYVLYI